MKTIGWVILFLIALPVHALEFMEQNTSVRALGMGNAFTAVVDNADALFYNPAGLNRVKGINWTILDLRAGLDGADVVQTAQSMNAANGSASAFQGFFGKKVWLGLGLKTALAMRGFAFAVYDSADLSASLSNPAFPTFNVRLINDYGFATGVSFELAPGLVWGLSGKRISRLGSDVPIGMDSLVAGSSLASQLDNRGTGFSLDTGFLVSIPAPVKPTFSFVWKDVGQTRFTKEIGSTAPPITRDEMIFGFALNLEGPLFTLTPSFDVKHLNLYDEQIGKKLHFGLELKLPLISLRGGLNQGYYTAGVGIDTDFLRIDAATYGVERGVYPGQDEDRRYVIEATLELGFDPSFAFLKSGDRKRLKQRR